MSDLFTCPISFNTLPIEQGIAGEAIIPDVVAQIRRTLPDWDGEMICEDCHQKNVAASVSSAIEAEMGEISALEQRVVDCMAERDILAENLNVTFERQQTSGQHLANCVAQLVGSWPFVAMVVAALVSWVLVTMLLDVGADSLDLHPAIIMSVGLACLSAIQGPIILMAQNHQKARDQLRAENDYQINLKAEFELRYLAAKLDLVLARQRQRLLDIHERQHILIQELTRQAPQSPGSGHGKSIT